MLSTAHPRAALSDGAAAKRVAEKEAELAPAAKRRCCEGVDGDVAAVASLSRPRVEDVKCSTHAGEGEAAEKMAAAAEEVEEEKAAAGDVGEAVGMAELVEAIEAELADGSAKPLKARRRLQQLMSRYDAACMDWKRFAHFDDGRYTRNLVATDGKRYTLLLLCWATAQESPVHDHPCDGCWMRVISGSVRERQFKPEDGKIVQTTSTTMSAGEVAFINDSIALHSVGNPSETEVAVTLHLYSPPFQTCRVWMSDSVDDFMKPTITHHSEGGQLMDDC